MKLYLFAILSMCWIFVGCGRTTALPTSSHLPPGLTVPQDATDLKVRREGESAEVDYNLWRAFPSDALLREIDGALAKQGFSKMAMDWLNPTMPSSHSQGWKSFIDGRRRPEVAVHRWLAEWKNASGEVVVYELTYRSSYSALSGSPEVPDNDHLSVAIACVPAARAKAMMSAAKQMTSTP
jgi:hypothetical protein